MVNLQKPPRGARINWADPITRGLVGCWVFNEYGGKVVSCKPYGKSDIIGGVSWVAEGVKTDDATGYIITEDPHGKFNSSLFSFVCRMAIHSFSQYDKIVQTKYTNSWNGYGWSLEAYNTSTFTFLGSGDNYGDRLSINWSYNTFFTFALRKQLSNWIDIFKDGKFSDNQGCNDIIPSGFPITFAYYQQENKYIGATYEFAYYFSRPLTDDEIARLSAEPYSFLKTPSSRAYFYVASGTTVSLDLGALSLTGYDISVQAGASVSMELGELALSGYDVSVQVGVNVIIAMESGAISLLGEDVVVNTGVTVSMELGELSFTGYDVNAGTAITVSIKITTTEAQAISGALVTIGDSFSEMTDSNGEVSGNIIPGTYTLIITKAGYQTYQAQIEITGSIDWQIALNKQVGIIITGCGASVNLGPKNPTNVLYT